MQSLSKQEHQCIYAVYLPKSMLSGITVQSGIANASVKNEIQSDWLDFCYAVTELLGKVAKCRLFEDFSLFKAGRKA